MVPAEEHVVIRLRDRTDIGDELAFMSLCEDEPESKRRVLPQRDRCLLLETSRRTAPRMRHQHRGRLGGEMSGKRPRQPACSHRQTDDYPKSHRHSSLQARQGREPRSRQIGSSVSQAQIPEEPHLESPRHHRAQRAAVNGWRARHRLEPKLALSRRLLSELSEYVAVVAHHMLRLFHLSHELRVVGTELNASWRFKHIELVAPGDLRTACCERGRRDSPGG